MAEYTDKEDAFSKFSSPRSSAYSAGPIGKFPADMAEYAEKNADYLKNFFSAFICVLCGTNKKVWRRNRRKRSR